MNEPAPDELTFVAAQHSYDATGRHIQVTQTTSKPSPTNANVIFTTATTTGAAYDGDGQQLKRVQTKQVNSNQPQVVTSYYLRSSVLGGQVITDYDGQGARKNGYVYAGGSLVYEQVGSQSWWHVTNPLTGDARDTDATGKLVNDTHLDPVGVNTGASDPANMQGDPVPAPLPHAGAYAAYLPHSLGGAGQCAVDGAEYGCGFIESLRRSGGFEECLDGNCGKQQATIIARNGDGDVIGRTTRNLRTGSGLRFCDSQSMAQPVFFQNDSHH